MSNDPPWCRVPLTDRLYVVWFEAGVRRFPPWMMGTLYEALERLDHQDPKGDRDVKGCPGSSV